MSLKSIFESVINTDFGGSGLFIVGILLGYLILDNKENIEEYLRPKKDHDKKKRGKIIFFALYFVMYMWLNIFKITPAEWFGLSFIITLLLSLLIIKVVDKKWPIDDKPTGKRK